MPFLRSVTRRGMLALGVVACSLVGVVAAIVVVAHLQQNATASRDAQLRLATLRLDLSQIQYVPWGASPGDPEGVASVRNELRGDEIQIRHSLAGLARGGRLPEAAHIRTPFARAMTSLWEILRLCAAGRQDQTGPASNTSARQLARADIALQGAASRFRSDAQGSLWKARVGSAAAILALFAAFAWFYLRARAARTNAEGLVAENRKLLALSREESLTDALTGLRNRRSLMIDLAATEAAATGRHTLLALFDLDGFKAYNDHFGHPAGDALLARLGEHLAAATAGVGTAYRMGGDEFCVLAPVVEGAGEDVTVRAAAALSESGEGFVIGCSYGAVLIPSEAANAEDALQLADARMYDAKNAERSTPERRSADMLVQALAERRVAVDSAGSSVALLADRTAMRLGVPGTERDRIRLAAQLHDVGNAAIPDAILAKPGPLDPGEWDFVRRHSTIGERIVGAARSLCSAAELVRSHQERFDGTGYPDGLAGAAIPIGARIIAVSEAYAAMVADRPYRRGMAAETALSELRRGAGTQFDPAVVQAFVAAAADARAA
jgi:diguanylate cyclase (GGDEF)-like protein